MCILKNLQKARINNKISRSLVVLILLGNMSVSNIKAQVLQDDFRGVAVRAQRAALRMRREQHDARIVASRRMHDHVLALGRVVEDAARGRPAPGSLIQLKRDIRDEAVSLKRDVRDSYVALKRDVRDACVELRREIFDAL